VLHWQYADQLLPTPPSVLIRLTAGPVTQACGHIDLSPRILKQQLFVTSPLHKCQKNEYHTNILFEALDPLPQHVWQAALAYLKAEVGVTAFSVASRPPLQCCVPLVRLSACTPNWSQTYRGITFNGMRGSL